MTAAQECLLGFLSALLIENITFQINIKRFKQRQNFSLNYRNTTCALHFSPSIYKAQVFLYHHYHCKQIKFHPNCTMVKNHTKTANIQPTLASEPIGHILPCSSLDLETERTGKYAIPNDGYILEQSNARSSPLWPFTVRIDHLLTHKFLHKIARTASNVCIEHNSGVHKPLFFSFFGIESPSCRDYLANNTKPQLTMASVLQPGFV